MKPPHLSQKSAADPLQFLKPGMTRKLSAQNPFRDSLAAVERNKPGESHATHEVQVLRPNAAPKLGVSAALPSGEGEALECEATDLSHEQKSLPVNLDNDRSASALFNNIIPASSFGEAAVSLPRGWSAGTTEIGGDRNLTAGCAVETKIGRPAAKSASPITAQASTFDRPADVAVPVESVSTPHVRESTPVASASHCGNDTRSKPELPILVTARSTHLLPARLPPVYSGSRPAAPKEAAPLVQPDGQKDLSTGDPQPSDTPGTATGDPMPIISRPSRRQEESRITPRLGANVDRVTKDAQPAEKEPQGLLVTGLPSPAQPASSTPQPDVPPVPGRIGATVISSVVVANPEAHPVKSLTLQLHPDELGSVSVTMRLRPQEIALRIETESEKTLALLQRDEGALRQVLQAVGYDGEQASLHIVLKPAIDAPSPQPVPQTPPAGPERGFSSPFGSQPDSSPSGHRHGQPQGQRFQPGQSSHDDAPRSPQDRPRGGVFV